MTVYINREQVVEQWDQLIGHAGGKDKWVMETTEQKIKEVGDSNISCSMDEVSTGYFGEKRDFLIVTHYRLREYAMFIGARDYGADLYVSWYLTLHPGFLKRTISKQIAQGNQNALSMNLNMFLQQDLRAYVGIGNSCLQEVVKELMEELKQDYSSINRKSKGFLSVW